MEWCRGIYTCVGICDREMHRDLWSYLIPGREEHECGCFLALCWQQQSRWRVLLLIAWCLHGKWGGRWRTQKIGRRRHWCCVLQTHCPLGAHSSYGKFGVIVEGGCHLLFSDQGPLLKGGGWCGREVSLQKSLDFFVRMFRGTGVFTCNEAYKFWCKADGWRFNVAV